MTNSVASKVDDSAPAKQGQKRGVSPRMLGTLLLVVPPAVAGALVFVTIRHRELNEVYYVNSAYYLITVMLAVYACVELSGLGTFGVAKQWLRDHWAGLLMTTLVCGVVLAAVAPGYRVLADEANLIGVSKNLFYQRTANFATTGKWYFENFWNLNMATDRRPTLFPYFVSLLHVMRGYHPENGFHFNAIVFVLFVFAAYRLAKGWAGELFGLATAVLVATNPNTLIAARSAGFDLLSCFMLLVVFRGFVEFSIQRTPRRLAILAMQLCLLAHVRYEGWALMLAAGAVLLSTRMVRRQHFEGFAYLYSFLPIFLLPRYWQSIAKANDAEQPLSAALFSLKDLLHNTGEYLRLLRRPLDVSGPHSPLLMILAIGGIVLFVVSQFHAWRKKSISALTFKHLLLAAVLIGAEFVISFSYNWGKSLHPSSCRLFIWLDTVVAFAAAWALTMVGRQFTMSVAVLNRQSAAPATLVSSLALFAIHVPVASEARFTNSLVLTRQAAYTWRFFENLHEKNILVMTDRPGLFTIMDIGALDISSALTDRGPLLELSRHLYQDVYLIQEVDLNTKQPLQQFDVWPEVPKDTVMEFQNTDSASVRIAKLKR
jgi:hypothetical protein